MALSLALNIESPFHPARGHESSGARASHSSNAQTEAGQRPGRPASLSGEDQQQVKDLAARDREVKAHEAAHVAAGGGLTGSASYSYTTGPDGKRYATGGEVGIDTSKMPGDPQATLLKANRVRAAALAPAEPSAQDRQVAAKAAQMAAQARMELVKQPQTLNDGEQANDSTQLQDETLYTNSGSVGAANNPGKILDVMA